MAKRSSIRPILILLPLAALLIAGSLPPQDGHDLFQKALARERGEGRLEEAVALYREVIDRTRDEALAAKAQLRIGICYEKLGREKSGLAQKAFQKVIDNYPKQVETVIIARKKLDGFIDPGSRSKERRGKFSIGHLITGMEAESAQVSPDGRFLAYFDNVAGSMAVHELETGGKKILKSRITPDEMPGESWIFRWSPDGKAIACNWWREDGSEVRIMATDGSSPRRVLRSEEYEEVFPMDWSSDGRYILAAFFKKMEERKAIGLLSVEDGSVNILKYIDGSWGMMGFSPDDRFVVFDFLPDLGNPKRDISVISVSKSTAASIVAHPADDRFLGWPKEHDYIVFDSNRLGSHDLWIVPIREGRPVGEPELVKRGLGDITAAGLTEKGTFYYTSSKRVSDIFVSEIDQLLQGKPEHPDSMTLSRENGNLAPRYSPDGKYLLFLQKGQGQNRICIYSLDSGEERHFILKGLAYSPQWSPDGQHIYFTDWVRPRVYGIHRLELKTGRISTAWPEEPALHSIGDIFVGMSPDGESYFYIHSEEEKKICRLMVRGLKSQREKVLFSMEVRLPFRADLSPDGKWLAVINREDLRSVLILPTSGGPPRELYQWEQKGQHPPCLDFTADSHSLVFSKRREDQGWGLCKISSKTGDLVDLGISSSFISEVCVHPDGKKLAFCSNGPDWKGLELWVMENFLPRK